MRFPLRKVIDFSMTKPGKVDEAYQEFFGSLPVNQLQKEWEELFLEWLTFDYKQKGGTTFLVEYILRNPDNFDAEKIGQFEQISRSQFYSMFEIKEINKGEWFILEDLHTGKIYKVLENTGTTILKDRGSIPGRIAKVDGNWYLVGANSVYFPLTHTQRSKKYMRKFKITNYSPKDTVELLMEHDKNLPAPPEAVTKKQIKNRRKQLKQDFEENAEKYNFSLSFDALISEIYQENRANVLDFWKSLTKKGLSEKFLYEKPEVMQDIWNYFPHKCLNGLSPVEAYVKMKESK